MVLADGKPLSDARVRTAGGVAIEIARQLAEPVRSLRDRLGLVVDHLERHVATATGPTPYPWRSLQALRQDLAGSYLEATTLARRLDELDRALEDETPGWFELGPAVDLGLRLASHHLGDGLEILIDLGQTPPVRGTPGMLALVVAQLVGTCAQSARALPGSALSVRTFFDPGATAPMAGSRAIVLVTDNGGGSSSAAQTSELVREILEPWGASIDMTSQDGQGCAFELQLLTVPA
jgi:signal transduction histidine kinase